MTAALVQKQARVKTHTGRLVLVPCERLELDHRRARLHTGTKTWRLLPRRHGGPRVVRDAREVRLSLIICLPPQCPGPLKSRSIRASRSWSNPTRTGAERPPSKRPIAEPRGARIEAVQLPDAGKQKRSIAS